MKTYKITVNAMIKVKAESKTKAFENVGKTMESHHAVEYTSINLILLNDDEE